MCCTMQCRRVVVWKQLGVPYSFTLEASFCGPDYGPLQGAHFSTVHLQEMGAAFVPALLDLSDPLQVIRTQLAVTH